jgi:hypothetical protein
MKEVISQIKSLTAGDLVQVEWCDASIGKSLSNGVSGIDVPVKSWGVFIGLLGQRTKHVILAQNCFRYSDGLDDERHRHRESSRRGRRSEGFAQQFPAEGEDEGWKKLFQPLLTSGEGA